MCLFLHNVFVRLEHLFYYQTTWPFALRYYPAPSVHYHHLQTTCSLFPSTLQTNTCPKKIDIHIMHYIYLIGCVLPATTGQFVIGMKTSTRCTYVAIMIDNSIGSTIDLSTKAPPDRHNDDNNNNSFPSGFSRQWQRVRLPRAQYTLWKDENEGSPVVRYPFKKSTHVLSFHPLVIQSHALPDPLVWWGVEERNPTPRRFFLLLFLFFYFLCPSRYMPSVRNITKLPDRREIILHGSNCSLYTYSTTVKKSDEGQSIHKGVVSACVSVRAWAVAMVENYGVTVEIKTATWPKDGGQHKDTAALSSSHRNVPLTLSLLISSNHHRHRW
jgi:hypothetical protein